MMIAVHFQFSSSLQFFASLNGFYSLLGLFVTVATIFGKNSESPQKSMVSQEPIDRYQSRCLLSCKWFVMPSALGC